MSEGSASEELRAPDEWDKMEGLDWKWTNIRMKELVWSDLPPGAEEAIEDFIRVDKCSGRDIERVHRLDPQTIEIVWYDDEGEDEEDPSPTEVSDRYVRNVRTVVQEMFGEHWRVRRKDDDRRWNSTNPQRVIVRRADHQRFQYKDESDEKYLLRLHGKPDNVPEGVDFVGALDQYRSDPELSVDDKRDVYTYETGTGTVHLLPCIRDRVVAVDQSCECGLTVQAEEIVDGERIMHYADYLREEGDLFEQGITGQPDPKKVIGDDLCTRCWKTYARTQKTPNGRVRGYEAPNVDYEALLTEGRHD